MNEAEWVALRRRVRMQRYGRTIGNICAPAAYLLAVLHTLTGHWIAGPAWLLMSGGILLVSRWETPLVKVEEFRG